jgi:hypothetical protein
VEAAERGMKIGRGGERRGEERRVMRVVKRNIECDRSYSH